MATAHRWHFFRAGEVEQVALRDGSDIARLPELDPKLWAALAMPTKGVELDAVEVKQAPAEPAKK